MPSTKRVATEMVRHHQTLWIMFPHLYLYFKNFLIILLHKRKRFLKSPSLSKTLLFHRRIPTERNSVNLALRLYIGVSENRYNP